MAPSVGRNVKLIVSAAAASVASVPNRIVDTFGQRANDDEYAGTQSSKMAQ